ncbi:MAG: hypothetical protein D6761_08510 [Candidatus Dadabacteria bacterium]|nr:MAG: hypothetical protein D6761_08510 [Candidatus Dadabacteria bacterium]
MIEAIKQDTSPELQAAEQLIRSFDTDAVILGCTELSVLAARAPELKDLQPTAIDPVEILIARLRERCQRPRTG